MAARVTMIALGCGLAALSACTQALGLERAHLEQGDAGHAGHGGQASGGGGQGSTTQSADSVVWYGCEDTPTEECSGCFQSCLLDLNPGFGVAQCLETRECRRSFDAYDGCRGPSCDAELAEEECAPQLQNLAVQECAIACLGDCAQTALVTDCEYYCGCMADACDATEPFDTCVRQCEDLPAEVSVCFRRHCRAAALAREVEEVDRHCRHARNDPSAICRSYLEAPPETRATDCGLDKNPSDWNCDVPSQCCSGACNNGVCE